MHRHYRYAAPAQCDARRERIQDPRDDKRDEGSIYLELGGVVVDWRLVPYWRNVRQFKALERSTGEPVMVDGKPLIAGKDEIGRYALSLLPKYLGLRNLM